MVGFLLIKNIRIIVIIEYIKLIFKIKFNTKLKLNVYNNYDVPTLINVNYIK